VCEIEDEPWPACLEEWARPLPFFSLAFAFPLVVTLCEQKRRRFFSRARHRSPLPTTPLQRRVNRRVTRGSSHSAARFPKIYRADGPSPCPQSRELRWPETDVRIIFSGAARLGVLCTSSSVMYLLSEHLRQPRGLWPGRRASGMTVRGRIVSWEREINSGKEGAFGEATAGAKILFPK